MSNNKNCSLSNVVLNVFGISKLYDSGLAGLASTAFLARCIVLFKHFVLGSCSTTPYYN